MTSATTATTAATANIQTNIATYEKSGAMKKIDRIGLTIPQKD